MVSLFVLILLCSSILAMAQDINASSADDASASCNLGCSIWQFLFGSQDARAGKAWFDRSAALVGEATKAEEASVLFKKGMEYYNKKGATEQDYVQAEKYFREADATFSTLNIKFMIGASLQAQGKYKEALPILKEVAETPKVDDKYKETVAQAKEAVGVSLLNDLPTWTKETNNQFTKPGTVYKNDKGDYFITNKEGKGVKTSKEEVLKQIQNSATESSGSSSSSSGGAVVDTKDLANLKSALGEATYNNYLKSVGGKLTRTVTRPDGTLVMEGKNGIITVKEDKDQKIQLGERTANGKVVENFIVKDGQLLASQDNNGNVKVGDATYKFPKDKSINELLDGQGVQLPGEKGEASGFLQLKNGVVTAVDYDAETMQVINGNTKESMSLKVDYYKNGEAGCGTSGGCVVPTGGDGTFIGANGKAEHYLVDYDYKTLTGAERGQVDSNGKLTNLDKKEYFNPQTGKQEGTELPDGTKIIAERKYNDDGKGQVGYTGLFEVTDENGLKGLITKDEKGNWVPAEEGQSAVGFNWLANEKNKQLADDRYSSTQGNLASAQTTLESIYKVTNNIKSYPAISHLLFGNANFYKNWRSSMDKAFAPLLGSNWFPSAICENTANRWQDLEPEGKAVIKTVSGTYQAVASIQMERSQDASPILCHKNPDQESDQHFICNARQVCVKDKFCYADQDLDHQADSKDPLKGYFYKVTWAVSAPKDEAQTPLIDENGVAVSFNIFLYPGAVPMYNLNGNIAAPIQLQNGASDRDAIIKYSANVYDHACIHWNQAPITVKVPGGKKIDDVCFNAVTSSVGEVNWQRSGQGSTSVSQNKGSISKNTDW